MVYAFFTFLSAFCFAVIILIFLTSCNIYDLFQYYSRVLGPTQQICGRKGFGQKTIN